MAPNSQQMLPMMGLLLLLITLVLIADVALLVRWLIYRLQLPEIPYQGTEAELVSPRPPFAPTWSLVHPFLGFQVLLMLTGVFMVFLFVCLGVLFKDLTANAANPLLTRTGIWVTILTLFVQNILMVGIPAFCIRLYGSNLAEIGFGKLERRKLLVGLGWGLCLFGCAFVLEQGLNVALTKLLSPKAFEALTKMTEGFDAGSLFRQMPTVWSKIGLALGGAIAAPIGEEVFFRGWVYNALKRRWGIRVGIVLSGLLFALAHIGPLALLIIFPMGMLLAYAYERTGSLWVTIGMHAANNGLAFLLLGLFPNLGK